MLKLYDKYAALLDKLKDLPPLIFRLILAKAFYGPAMKKITDFDGTAAWFERLEIPFPLFNAYLAGITEFMAIWLMILGLGTRIIALPMIITLLVAVYTVHTGDGYNGMKIQLFYMAMCFFLMVYGPGRISADYLIKGRRKKRR
jgi:putative oxidoreductase